MSRGGAETETGINLTDRIAGIIGSIVRETDLFSHVDPERVLVCLSSNRRGSPGATYGKLVPLRFPGGLPVQRYRGRHYALPRIMHRGLEMRYLIYFYVPRFFNLPAREKLRVIFHELYHICPSFNGDIRRLGSRRAAHGGSVEGFNGRFEGMLLDYWERIDGGEREFLQMSESDIRDRYAPITGLRMKMPRPVAIE